MSNIEIAYRKFCEERFPLPSEKQVADLEKRIGILWPPDFRQYLLEYNGGFFTEPQIIPPSEGCPVERLTFVNGIGATDPVAELANIADLSLLDDNDPPQIVPIVGTLMGHLIYLVTHPENRGSIGLKKMDSDECFLLAEGIEEFFGLLREPTDD